MIICFHLPKFNHADKNNVQRILILSDNKPLIDSCQSILGSVYQTDSTASLNNEAIISSNAILVDASKIDQDPSLLSIFSVKSTRFLILGHNWPEEKQINALVHGAAGYCGEPELQSLLNLAIERILKGDIWIQRHLVPQVIGILVHKKSTPEVKSEQSPELTDRLKTLSKRELDVANMIGTGVNNKVIANTLNISERTVKAHLTSIFKKLKTPDRLHLALIIKNKQ